MMMMMMMMMVMLMMTMIMMMMMVMMMVRVLVTVTIMMIVKKHPLLTGQNPLEGYLPYKSWNFSCHGAWLAPSS